MKKITLALLLALVSTFALISCASVPTGTSVETGSSEDPFDGTAWTTADGTALYGQILVGISFADGKATGTALGNKSKAYKVVKADDGSWAAVVKGVPLFSTSYVLVTEPGSTSKGTLTVTASVSSQYEMVKK